jgi:hypothetical protein
MPSVITFLLGGLAMLALLAVVGRFLGFNAQRPSDYAEAAGPRLDIREHLSGPMLCEGVVYGPTGRVASRFVADMDARWEGNRGVVSERFRYDSGTTQNREWRLTLGNEGSIHAEADDIVGAGQGRQAGSAAQLRYRIRLPESAGGHVLDTTDWMYLVENGTVVNRSQFRKFGIKVAELVATIRKKDS